jgi:hypothetical protein
LLFSGARQADFQFKIVLIMSCDVQLTPPSPSSIRRKSSQKNNRILLEISTFDLSPASAMG